MGKGNCAGSNIQGHQGVKMGGENGKKILPLLLANTNRSWLSIPQLPDFL